MAYFIETVLADIFEVDELRHKDRSYEPYEIRNYVDWINKDHLHYETADNFYLSYHGVHICKVNDVRQLWEEQ